MTEITTPPTAGAEGPAGPGDPAAAVAELVGVVDRLAGLSVQDFVGVGADGLWELLGEVERVRNRLAVIDHTMIAAAETVGLAQRHSMASMTKLLAHGLRISAAEAKRRTTAAAVLTPQTMMSGEIVPAVRPVLADAVRSGEVAPGVTDVAVRALARIGAVPDVDPVTVADAEAELARQAGEFGPAEYRRLAEHVVAHVDPDGPPPTDGFHQSQRSVRFHTGTDGMMRLEGRLTPAVGQMLRAVLDPLSTPCPGPDSGAADHRSRDERLHDALETALGRLLRSGTLPASGGAPATVIVTITAEDLQRRAGYGVFTDGTTIEVDALLRWAVEADILPVVLGASGEVLSLGRSHRLADANITAALYARDAGCTFPGCTMPPEWCERHHILAWIDDGDTDIDNMTLLCGWHHRNFDRLGWTCRMINQIPWWIPPTYQDPKQNPRINNRFLLHHRERGTKPPEPTPTPEPVPDPPPG